MEGTTRRISCGVNKDIVVISDSGPFIFVYRTQDRESGVFPKSSPGVPSDCSEYFRLNKDTSDEWIVKCVEVFEQGHRQGWADGQFVLRRDLQHMLGIWK